MEVKKREGNDRRRERKRKKKMIERERERERERGDRVCMRRCSKICC